MAYAREVYMLKGEGPGACACVQELDFSPRGCKEIREEIAAVYKSPIFAQKLYRFFQVEGNLAAGYSEARASEPKYASFMHAHNT